MPQKEAAIAAKNNPRFSLRQRLPPFRPVRRGGRVSPRHLPLGPSLQTRNPRSQRLTSFRPFPRRRSCHRELTRHNAENLHAWRSSRPRTKGWERARDRRRTAAPRHPATHPSSRPPPVATARDPPKRSHPTKSPNNQERAWRERSAALPPPCRPRTTMRVGDRPEISSPRWRAATRIMGRGCLLAVSRRRDDSASVRVRKS
mmetsp:Transcript_35067/g.75731  ORF Transcript_35067/g.75731 Transcript_35067/m.75731 type:complete len:202 (-) Transcript_35067:332-937(-)